MTSIPRKCHKSQMGLLLCNKHLLQLRKDQPFDCVQLQSLPFSVQSGFIRSRERTIPLLMLKELTAPAAFKPCTLLHTVCSAEHIFDAVVNS